MHTIGVDERIPSAICAHGEDRTLKQWHCCVKSAWIWNSWQVLDSSIFLPFTFVKILEYEIYKYITYITLSLTVSVIVLFLSAVLQQLGSKVWDIIIFFYKR